MLFVGENTNKGTNFGIIQVDTGQFLYNKMFNTIEFVKRHR